MNDYKRVRDRGDKRPRRAELLANLHLNGTTWREREREGEPAAARVIIPLPVAGAIRHRRRRPAKEKNDAAENSPAGRDAAASPPSVLREIESFREHA